MGIFDSLLNIFFPPTCASCKTEGDFLCKNCVQEFRPKILRAKSFHSSRDEFTYLDGVIYGLDYGQNPQIQAAIRQFKYKFTKQLVTYFGQLTSQKLRQLGMLKNREAVLIPVPLHKKRLNYRGFNQAELIAREAVREFDDKAEVLSFLSRTKNTSQQAKLNKKERHQNLKEAFEVIGDLSQLSEKVCFLVDDVCTTGATLDSCAQILKGNGLKKVYGLVVARAFK